jgi:hypothetical protein
VRLNRQFVPTSEAKFGQTVIPSAESGLSKSCFNGRESRNRINRPNLLSLGGGKAYRKIIASSVITFSVAAGVYAKRNL